MAFTVEGLNGRRWLFSSYHETLLHAHRPFTETHQLVRRTAFWEGLASDVAEWCRQCSVRARYRSRAVLPPMRSILADDQMLEVLPWADVIVDVARWREPRQMPEPPSTRLLKPSVRHWKRPNTDSVATSKISLVIWNEPIRTLQS